MINRLNFLKSMKIYALYYRDTFVIAYPTREDCVAFGKQHYDGWDCSIVEKYMSDGMPSPAPVQVPTPPLNPFSPWSPNTNWFNCVPYASGTEHYKNNNE
jgi:hypothetical protein